MSHNPVTTMVALLNADVTLGLTKGTNLFGGAPRGPDADVAVNSVFVSPSAGGLPVRTMGEVAEIRFAVVNVRVRNSKHGAGLEQAIAIQNVIQASVIAGYLDINLLQSAPTLLGEDAETNPMWSLGVEMKFEEVK